MPINDIASPAQAAPVDRMTLGMGWVRPSGAVVGVGGPAGHNDANGYFVFLPGTSCFEGCEE